MDLVLVRTNEGDRFATERRFAEAEEIVGGPADMTAEDVASALADDATNGNYHDVASFFLGLPLILAAAIGAEASKQALLAIADAGGFNP